MTFKPQTILYIPDVHVKRDDALTRFYFLKRWLADRNIKLDHIVQGGDLWDMEAFCLHDQTTPEWYDRHFWDEFSRGFDALDILEDWATRFGNRGCKVSLTEGNHEHRYSKWMQSDNRLRTSPFPKTVADLIKFYRPKSKVNYVPFLQPLILNDTAFSHYFVSGLMGRPQGGERPASTILKAQHMSCVGCHSHVLDYAERTRADGRKIHALIGGWFGDPEAKFAFAGAAYKLWWNGVHLLHFTKPGEFDVESVSLARLSA
jgi:hypothetical protein